MSDLDYFNQETERLKLRRIVPEDVDNWVDFFVGNDRLHFVGLDASPGPQKLAENWIEKQLGRYRDFGRGHLGGIDKITGEMVGMAGILNQEIDGEKFYEIGYSVKPAYWGKGFASEMSQHLKTFAFESGLCDTIYSIVHKDNAASARVAEKNGMTIQRESVFKEMPVNIYGVDKS
jgi:RimJ/RimL family protein N-acetyltransferase